MNDDDQLNPTHISSASALKEGEPRGDIIASEPEINLPKEVEEVGVEASPEKPQLTEEHKQAGISHASQFTPAEEADGKTIQLPTKEEIIKEEEKKRPITDAIRWFIALVKRQRMKGAIK